MNVRSFLATLTLLALFTFPASAVTISSLSELQDAINAANAGGDKNIHIQSGIYNLTEEWGYLLSADGIKIKGDGIENTILKGEGMLGGVNHAFQVTGKNVSIEDLAIQDVAAHGIQVHGENSAEGTQIRRVLFRNIGDQYLKVSYLESNPQVLCKNGVVEDCVFIQTETAPDFYTGGIDAHAIENWVIKRNTFTGIKSPDTSTPAEAAIHIWSNSRGTLIEQNKVMNCDRGIGLGLLRTRGHEGGVIRNNFIFHDSSPGDVGIELESSNGASVYNNTIILLNNYQAGISVRYSTPLANHLANNLLNKSIWKRDGGNYTEQNNHTSAQIDWFKNASGDLHLKNVTTYPVDKGIELAGLTDDIDGETRTGNIVDIGADEFYQENESPDIPRGENSPVLALGVGMNHFPSHFGSYLNWVKTEIPNLFPVDGDTSDVPPDTSDVPPDTTSTPPEGLFTASNLKYLGAFRLPDGSKFDYSSGNMTFKATEGGTGILYYVGREPNGSPNEFGYPVCELSIPVPVKSKNLTDLPKSTILHNFVDITQGKSRGLLLWKGLHSAQ